MKLSDPIGPYRFKYPDDGLAVYRISDVVEQYLACDEYFWWQVLRVGKKVYKFQVCFHTKEEERMKIWKTFRGLEKVDRPINDTIDVKKATAGQFKLTWMSSSELSQAMRILEDKNKEQEKEEYSTLTKAMETAMAKKRQEEEIQYHNSCCFAFSCFYCDCGGCMC